MNAGDDISGKVNVEKVVNETDGYNDHLDDRLAACKILLGEVTVNGKRTVEEEGNDIPLEGSQEGVEVGDHNIHHTSFCLYLYLYPYPCLYPYPSLSTVRTSLLYHRSVNPRAGPLEAETFGNRGLSSLVVVPLANDLVPDICPLEVVTLVGVIDETCSAEGTWLS